MFDGKYKVIDNFLDKKLFFEIQSAFMGSEFPWYYNSHKVKAGEILDENERYNFQFGHTLYKNFSPTSEFISVISPLIEQINPSALVRIKANMNPVTDKRVVFGYHTDFDKTENLNTAVFYLNTNNGATIFKDGPEIESLENRLVVFDSNLLHAGTSCTDEKVRCLINLNYYSW